MSEVFSSDKHSAMHDDALKQATEGLVRSGRSTHAEEWRDPEPSGEDQPEVDLAPDGALVGGTPDGMSAADVADRSQLATYLGRAYPVDKASLLATAEGNNAPASVLDLLAQLPEGATFDNLHDVWSALGRGTEEHRF